jgi:V/A-type H+-transporting ATPase subunit F
MKGYAHYMARAKIAAIGSADDVKIFNALGIEVRITQTDEEAASALGDLARDKYAVIYITEDVAGRIGDTIARYRSELFPAVIPIPNASGASGLGMGNVRKNAAMAVGSDILLSGKEVL